MSQAENLLNGLSSYEIDAYSADISTEGHIVISSDRFITVPESLKRIAVQFDNDVETVTFDCPRYWDNLDLSTMKIYINYKLPNNSLGSYIAKNISVDTSNDKIMHFDWTISRDVSLVKGTIFFLVCIKKTDSNGNETNRWNSELCKDMYVSKGLECEETILDKYPSIITDLLTRMESVEEIATPEAMYNYVHDYLDKNADALLDNKADKSTTLAGYGITDGENIRNKVTDKSKITDKNANYPSIKYLDEYYYDYKEVDNELAVKSDLIQSKNIFDFDTWAELLQKSPKPISKDGTLDNIDFEEKSITFTSIANDSFTNNWQYNSIFKYAINVKPNTTYTLSWRQIGESGRCFVFFNGISTTGHTGDIISTLGKNTFTTKEDTSYITLRFGIAKTGSATISEIMLEEGNKKSLYLPYKVAEGVKELAKSTENAISDMTAETNTALEAKYDTSNVETGTGSLKPGASYTDLIKSSNFTYQKTGKIVNIFFNIVFNAGSAIYVQFSGLPFIPDEISEQNRHMTISNKNTQAAVYPVKNTLVLNFLGEKSIMQDEVFKDVLIIEIN